MRMAIPFRMMCGSIVWIIFSGFAAPLSAQSPDFEIFLPVAAGDRHSAEFLRLTRIGEYGLVRVSREHIPAHLHTGIDIQRPRSNYTDEPVYPVATGKVISVRTDGPYAQVIVEYTNHRQTFWTVYEHIAGVRAGLNDSVRPGTPIARFMNRDELRKYGWQFDHVHFEVLKVPPAHFPPDAQHPLRWFRSYSLVCYTRADLQKYFVDPMDFFRGKGF